MAAKQKQQEAQNPLILRSHRLMEAFAKSDDERDFYLDRLEGFILYVNLDKTEEELKTLESEIEGNPDRYCMIPKLTFFETKKIMEGFVNEKVYDIDTKEKLLDIIQSKEAREHFLEFIYDHHSELEKWQQYYQERSRIRIIEWLRNQHFHFVFEEDLDLSTKILEKLKESLFEKEVPREIEVARKSLVSKAKTYYSNEALNPRPKRGRPPKQALKLEMEPQITTDIYTTVSPSVRPFLFTPDISSVLDVTFSSRFETGQELLAHRKQSTEATEFENLNNISQKLATLRQLSSKWMEKEKKEKLPLETDLQDEGEEKSLEEVGEEEQILFKKLEDRKKSTKEKPIPQKPVLAPKKEKVLEPKTVKKLDIKEEKKFPTKEKPMVDKTPAKKRIMPQNIPPKKALPNSLKTEKISEKPRKIMPKNPPVKNKAKVKETTLPLKRPLRKTNEKKNGK
jgi:hypothetical protein